MTIIFISMFTCLNLRSGHSWLQGHCWMSFWSVWSKANQCLWHTGKYVCVNTFQGQQMLWHMCLLFFSLFRWQMSCASTQKPGGFFQTESALSRKLWVSIWRCLPPSSHPFRWNHNSPRYITQSYCTDISTKEMARKLLRLCSWHWMCSNHRCVSTGGKGDVVQASMSFTADEGIGSVSDPPAASQIGSAGYSHDRLRGLGGFISEQQPLRTWWTEANKHGG